MRPFKGEYASETIFITSNIIWKDPEIYIESRVIREKVSGISLLSDGVEKSSFLCNQKNKQTQLYYDPNQPYQPFFVSNSTTLLSMIEQDLGGDEIETRWRRYLDDGTESLKRESDDKTIILAIRRQLE